MESGASSVEYNLHYDIGKYFKNTIKIKQPTEEFSHQIDEECLASVMSKLHMKEFELKLWKWGFCGSTEVDNNKFAMK